MGEHFLFLEMMSHLFDEDIAQITKAYFSEADIPDFSKRVPIDEILENDYNLSVSTYVEAEDTREKVDIVKLNAEIREIVAREQVLRELV